MSELTHLDEKGRARMVDVGAKDVTERRAVARARLRTDASTLARILAGDLPKGDVLAVARTAGIMAAKQTPMLIPLCHPLPLSAVEVSFRAGADAGVLEIEARVAVTARTGAEMEALTAATIAGLTVYDMCKAVDKTMVLTDVRLVEKSGGRSGEFRRQGE
ncbi:MAG TPA: cyclic pyranopterin monophosphate synthase MoaC [Candidatus Limnocylindrales bacterium]|nr:cyclic pyranopterin monophosphate synthase MoaC [Candidatus Limnocylindrales bacterium]